MRPLWLCGARLVQDKVLAADRSNYALTPQWRYQQRRVLEVYPERDVILMCVACAEPTLCVP